MFNTTIVRIIDFELADWEDFHAVQSVLGQMLTEGFKIESSCRSEHFLTVFLSRPGTEDDLSEATKKKLNEKRYRLSSRTKIRRTAV